jgi:hypothetical protein
MISRKAAVPSFSLCLQGLNETRKCCHKVLRGDSNILCYDPKVNKKTSMVFRRKYCQVFVNASPIQEL